LISGDREEGHLAGAAAAHAASWKTWAVTKRETSCWQSTVSRARTCARLFHQPAKGKDEGNSVEPIQLKNEGMTPRRSPELTDRPARLLSSNGKPLKQPPPMRVGPIGRLWARWSEAIGRRWGWRSLRHSWGHSRCPALHMRPTIVLAAVFEVAKRVLSGELWAATMRKRSHQGRSVPTPSGSQSSYKRSTKALRVAVLWSLADYVRGAVEKLEGLTASQAWTLQLRIWTGDERAAGELYEVYELLDPCLASRVRRIRQHAEARKESSVRNCVRTQSPAAV
jgi:hypothetical protein